MKEVIKKGEKVVGKGALRLQDEEEGVDEGDKGEGGGEDGEGVQKNSGWGEILHLKRISRGIFLPSRNSREILLYSSRGISRQINPFWGGEILSLWWISRARVQIIPKLSHQKS